MEDEYYKTKESVEEYVQLAKDVSGKEQIKKLNDVLPANCSVLEIGSGPGTDWEILSESYNVVGSDYSSEFLKHLNDRHPKGKFLELDASTLDTDMYFDGIYSNKVMHHLTDEELLASIERQAQILKPEGIICHSFWKGEGTEVFKGLFVNYHTEASIREAFAKRFDVLLITPYKEFENNDSLLLIAKKK